jgi:FG-GAP-like repeat/ASPIC and UnbV
VGRVSILILALAQVAASPFQFEPVQPELFGLGGSFINAWADIDNDGDPDLFVGFGGTPNRLYRNDKGTFTDIAAEVGVADARATRAVAWGDFDADGDPDLLVGFTPGETSLLKLYRNDRGKFLDVTADAVLTVATGAVRQPSWIDTDADGDLDLFVAFRDRPNMFFRNAGNRFEEVGAAIGLADTRRSVGAAWLDIDDDADLDLVVANMDGDANGLYRNDNGKFTDVAESAGIAWGGRAPKDPANGTVRVCAADVDLDGRLDLFFANYGPNGLFLNRGNGVFEDVSKAWGVAIDGRYDTCAFADIDHDGRPDLYVNGTYTANKQFPDYLFRNTGTRFQDVTPDNVRALAADHGVAWADADGDGDLDLALTGIRPDGMHLLLRNGFTGAGRSIQVRVLDGRGRQTRGGAEVRAYAAGTRRLLGVGLVDTGSGYDAQNDLPVHVGIGTTEPVNVEVSFSAAGRKFTTIARVTPGRTVTVQVK